MSRKAFINLGTILLCSLQLASTIYASEPMLEPRLSLGTDITLPYVLQGDGSNVSSRANFALGVEGKYWWNDGLSSTLRSSFDVEKQAGTDRKILMGPGVQYRWMPGEAFRPYSRFDVPVTLAGAYGSGDQDIGISGGLGVAWNVGESIGIDALSARYDFDVLYNFGIGSAASVLSVEFFKVGFDYRF